MIDVNPWGRLQHAGPQRLSLRVPEDSMDNIYRLLDRVYIALYHTQNDSTGGCSEPFSQIP